MAGACCSLLLLLPSQILYLRHRLSILSMEQFLRPKPRDADSENDRMSCMYRAMPLALAQNP